MVRFNSFLNWSGGKDSAFSLFSLIKDKKFRICSLLTAFNSSTKRVTMHGVREELIEEQSRLIGIPLVKMYLPENTDDKTYKEKFKSVLECYRKENVFWSVFGDIYLQDLRKFREDILAEKKVNAYFPLWKKDTWKLSREFINSGFKAVVVCVDSSLLDRSFCGRVYDDDFLKDLPDNVDPCGENGEFHTFVYEGPVFSKKLEFKTGEIHYGEYGKRGNGFWFMDILSAGGVQ
ncbi:MAG: diphthine--ammonia ligase [Ignavibacteria bacterium]|nr:diphthine--ammonia ligase [Ignavibacteria bacterium]